LDKYERESFDDDGHRVQTGGMPQDISDAGAASLPAWPSCGRDGCVGVVLDGSPSCLAHADPDARAAFLAALAPDVPLDLRGVEIGPELLADVLSRMRPSDDDPPRIGRASFDGARFTGPARFPGLTKFTDIASFDRALFSGAAIFDAVQFCEKTSFEEAVFVRGASFAKASFSKSAWFVRAQFRKLATFTAANFEYCTFNAAQFDGDSAFLQAVINRNAQFVGTQFCGHAEFSFVQIKENAFFNSYYPHGEDTRFEKGANFNQARFGNANFSRAIFARFPGFSQVHVSGGASFALAQFLDSGTMTMGVEGALSFRKSSFSGNVVIRAAALRLECDGTTFSGAAALELRYSEILLDESVFDKPSIVSTTAIKFANEEYPCFESAAPQAQLLSVQRVDVSNLVLRDLDLSRCLFSETHNLSALRIEGPLRFASVPPPCRLHLLGRDVPLRRWMPRATLVEEHQLRAASSEPGHHRRLECPGWNQPAYQLPTWVTQQSWPAVPTLTAEALTAVYRDLRGGLEDQKNAPGAADFYYGEMEMRRLSQPPLPDRFVLWVYWLISGYGLRASRALIAFALAVLAFSVPFWVWGLHHPSGYSAALLQSFESATSVLRSPPVGQLSSVGQVLDGVLRLLGGGLLALALFSLRGRIKR
jgi:uncharacterized protein YjbI with pentapeptide repeats